MRKIKSIVATLLAITWIRSVYETVNRVFLETFGSSRLLSHLSFTVNFLPFNREQSAVLRGRRDYYRNKQRERTNRVELRRNVHRLEKGLIMRPRREVFAKDYIEETLEFYEAARLQFDREPSSLDVGELEWAHDVLTQYFAVTGADDYLDRQRKRFGSIPALPESEGKVPRPKRALSDVSYDELSQLVQQRRSVRWFEDKPVPRELIDQALLVAREAPTACNRLPYEFRIFDDPERVSRVAGLPFGAAGFAANIPTIIVVVGKLDSYFSPRDRHAIYVDASLAAMQFLLGLETLGLSSTVINWPDFEPLERQMQKELGLGVSDRVVMLIAVGYSHPEGLVPFSQKKGLESLRRFN